VVCLGDSFHDGKAGQRLGQADGERLAGLIGGRRWIWIVGNHDPTPPLHLGGIAQPELTLGPLLFRHIAAVDASPGEISGHFHPKAALNWRGRRLGGRCFIGDDRRLILPAFGAYAGGLDVRDPAIAGLFGQRTRIHILGQSRLHSFLRDSLPISPRYDERSMRSALRHPEATPTRTTWAERLPPPRSGATIIGSVSRMPSTAPIPSAPPAARG
jgi:metallophosphoesterase superfamily enzyme